MTRTGRVVAVDDRAGRAVVDCDGRALHVSTAPIVLDGRSVAPGDRVLIATGFALEILDRKGDPR